MPPYGSSTIPIILALTILATRSAAEIKERTVEFTGTGGVTLVGTISGPAKTPAGKLPGLVLIQGSGIDISHP